MNAYVVGGPGQAVKYRRLALVPIRSVGLPIGIGRVNGKINDEKSSYFCISIALKQEK